jgi:electron transport complex protein RnfE
MNKNNVAIERIINGIATENPIFIMMLGMCPTLAVTTSVTNGIGMGLSTTAVLVVSNLVISLVRKIIPDDVRLPAYIVIVASFVTVTQLIMQAYFVALNDSLGVYIPLIVVNCIILGRAEAFASKNTVLASALDGLFQGIGYTVALVIMCVIRELLGSGTFGAGVLNGGEGIVIISEGYPAMQMVMPVGGFLTLGFVIAGFQWYMRRRQSQKKEAAKK